MVASLALCAAAALVEAMHAEACLPQLVYLDVPAQWRRPDTRAAAVAAAARELGPFALRQTARRFALRYVAGLAGPVLVVQWQGRAETTRISIR